MSTSSRRKSPVAKYRPQASKYRCSQCGAWVTARDVHTIADCRKFDQSLALQALHLACGDFADFVEVKNPGELVAEYLGRAERGWTE